MLKKSSFLFALALTPFLAAAASLHIGGDYFLKGAEKAEDDVYVLGETGTFAGSVEGDIVALTVYSISEGDITADAVFIGEKVTLTGTVGDDARLLGETIVIGGNVADDVLAIGARVTVLPEASIGGNLYIVGGEVALAGRVSGNVRVFGGATTVAGAIGGNLESWGNTELMPGAAVKGDFTYHGGREIAVPEGARVEGALLPDHAASRSFRLAAVPWLASGLVSLQALMMLALGFFLFFFARERTEEVLVDVLPRLPRRLLRGALIVVCVPVLTALLFASVVGIPVALMFLCLFVALIVLGSAFAALLLGAWFERLFFRRSAFPLSYRPVVTGTLALCFIMVIPFVGFAVHAVLLLAAIGGIGTVFYRHVREVLY